MRAPLPAGLGRAQRFGIASCHVKPHKDNSLDSKIRLLSSSCQVIYRKIVHLTQSEAIGIGVATNSAFLSVGLYPWISLRAPNW